MLRLDADNPPRRESSDTDDATVRQLRQQLIRAQRLGSIGTMTAMVVHEFNNLLTPIINYAHLARRNPDLVDKALDSAVRSGSRATEICNAILGMTRQEGQLARPFRLREMIEETLHAMARDPQRDQIDLRIDVAEGLEMTARRLELQQVILNLLLNARSAVLERPAPRRIRLSAQIGDGNVLLRVADNGPGIEPHNLDRIFQPFFSTKSKTGNGLGLAICRDVLDGMGGRIAVRSTVGVGTVFTVTVPQTAPSDPL